jgi:MoCo/4Fe-4S cofactor protein with predicted Tat translocation signal
MSQSGTEHKSQYFRSISQLENTPEFEQFLHREFPVAASEFPEGVSRRRWLQLMGASLALGGVTGCRYQKEQIAEFVVRPEGRVAGVPNFFATNFEWAGRVINAIASNMDGRPIKLDGNPEHPLYSGSEQVDFKDGKEKKFASAGSDVFAQAAVLSLYDPDRLDHISGPNGDTDWASFSGDVAGIREGLKDGSGFAVVYEATRSPALQMQLQQFKAEFPKTSFVELTSVEYPEQVKSLKAVGVRGELMYNLTGAKVIACVDSDLLGADANAVFYARQFGRGRNPGADMNRLYCIESQYSVTGGVADFRLALRSSHVAAFMAKLEAAVDAAKAGSLAKPSDAEYSSLDVNAKIDRAVQVVAADLVAHQGSSLVTVGPHQPAAVQLAAMRINSKLGNFGKTVMAMESGTAFAADELMDVASFVKACASGEITTALVLGGNPVYCAPSSFKIGDALKGIKTVYLSDYLDETAQVATWVLPAAHPLESWGDVRSSDGTYGVCQPQIAPLMNGKSALEVLAMFATGSSVDGQALVKSIASKIVGGAVSERQWKEILHSGFLPSSQFKSVAINLPADGQLEQTSFDSGELKQGDLEVVFYPSPSVYDGRLANNGWLQELPQPVTKLTWDNAAIVSPKTAKAFGLVQGEMAHLVHNGVGMDLPIFVVPGQADGSVAVHIGYGRTSAGTVGTGVGHDVSALRPNVGDWVLTKAEIRGTTRPYKLATTQDHFSIDELGIKEVAKRAPVLIREGTLEQYNKDAKFAEIELHHEPESLWKNPDVAQGHAWGMTIDLNKCIGCNACVIACQAENNVPIVGKEQVSRGREMHWLRIDRYFHCDFEKTAEQGDFHNPVDVKVVHQPLACVHCENAPCEQVCPVAATVHTEEGINAMAYNRCVGTRYCANNCPYKVRRFNYFNFNTKYGYFYGWSDYREEVNTKLQSLVLNPEVTVRGRGVMEKCTYCIQRVQNGKIKARQTGDGLVHDGDIKSACQEACPTQAIVFGDLNDKSSRVSQLQRDPRSYAMLADLNVKPRTLYLARVRNVPKELMVGYQLHAKSESHGGHEHSKETHAPEEHS